ncbi:hypothetical protein U0070_007134 [Myodes glareolus]|uniref:Uncharacterized protein n=1 Tax=Myodes glareolus TaxID=447135 RepID=A0AAW0JQ95_MYOGA
MVFMSNREHVWNGDLLPDQLQAQDGTSTSSVTKNNCENYMGLITLDNDCEVLTTLTTDTVIILSVTHAVQSKEGQDHLLHWHSKRSI